jgi:hypothetical protein
MINKARNLNSYQTGSSLPSTATTAGRDTIRATCMC